MRILSWILLPVWTIFGGCLTLSSVALEEGADAESDVVFVLRDGSRVESFADHHPRVVGGYSVSGTIIRDGENPRRFDGVVADSTIDHFGVEHLSPLGTILGVGIGAYAIAFVNCGLAR